MWQSANFLRRADGRLGMQVALAIWHMVPGEGFDNQWVQHYWGKRFEWACFSWAIDPMHGVIT
jgi:hypothetical protein